MSDRTFDQQNAGYAQDLYEQFARNPTAVPEAWRRFFAQGPEAMLQAGLLLPEGLSGNGASAAYVAPPGTPASAEAERMRRLLPAVARAASLVQAFRDHGHMLAEIDPLGSRPPGHPQLDPAFFGMTLQELEEIPAVVVMGDTTTRDETLGDALRRLREAYAGSIGYEFEHLEDPAHVRWLWAQVESGEHTRPLERDEKLGLLRRLSEVEGFEHFLHRTYLGQKRFGIEGTDMLVPMLDLALEEAVRDGARDIVLGMSHRGRLNVLAHVVGINPEDILREFEGVPSKHGALTVSGTGDVKYHHGAEGQHELLDGRSIRVALIPNPSHLEFVNPVVLGMTRSMQFEDEEDRKQDTTAVVPILIHGDAAFAAEGVVAETLNLGRLAGYTVGGAIHIIVNNQIGFTTTPWEGRSTRYASDLAKGYDFPILHVNADEPEACLAVIRLAMAYRAKYRDDVVIDLVGYRRHGHNETDEPAYTQPKLYEKIAQHPTVRRIYADRLVASGVATPEDVRVMEERVAERLRRAHDRIQASETGRAEGPPPPETPVSAEFDTRVPFDVLVEINEAALTAPQGFVIHPKLKKQLDKRREVFAEDSLIEWAHAETLAFGSLLREGFVIRLTGQDSQRGTFSQRHLVLHDAKTGEEYVPLSEFGEGRFEIYNSPLTEAATLGFEYGYSVATKRDLVLWEGQFGDFVNAAQVAVDQFVASGREKWDQLANLGLLLPHGYEGQGPEHSSARLERFLILCAEGNMRVLYPTTPAQYFHLLRRQAHVRPERPMIVMTPKSLLRLPAAFSPVRDLANGRFHPVLDDPTAADRKDRVKRLIVCTGKIYYDLDAHDARTGAEDVALARIEEIYPFPSGDLETVVASYPALAEVVWTQEEPRNMGALTFVGPRLRAIVPRALPLRYVARPERASPAEGKPGDHNREQQRIVREALGVS